MGYDYDIPMLEANFVTTEQGTGIVHCAPSHGPDDFNLCLNNNIKAIETVDGDGKYTNEIKLFEGLHIFKANNLIIEKLNEQKNLVTNGKLTHSYPPFLEIKSSISSQSNSTMVYFYGKPWVKR